MAQAERDDRVLLARTWNDNPSGRLWEARWFRSVGRYYRDVDAPGVFVPAHEFPNEATFWADFEDERAKFHGMRAGDSRTKETRADVLVERVEQAQAPHRFSNIVQPEFTLEAI